MWKLLIKIWYKKQYICSVPIDLYTPLWSLNTLFSTQANLVDLLDEVSYHVDKDNGNKDKCKSRKPSFRWELRMISNKENNSLYNQEIS